MKGPRVAFAFILTAYRTITVAESIIGQQAPKNAVSIESHKPNSFHKQV